jgi:hypothetical protein
MPVPTVFGGSFRRDRSERLQSGGGVMTAPEVLTVEMVFAARENAEAIAKVREWCSWASSMVCSHAKPDCERCEAFEDYAAAILALLPPVPPDPEEGVCASTASSDP